MHGRSLSLRRIAAGVLAVCSAFSFAQAPPKVIIHCPNLAPIILKQVKPVYPAAALARGLQGRARIDLIVDKEGIPSKLRVVSGAAELAKAALDAVQQWRYKPYKLNGHAVEMETSVEVNFVIPPKKLDASSAAQRCALKVVKHGSSGQDPFAVRKGEKPSKYPPLVAFEIQESGEVANARITRSSGIADIDYMALNWIRGTRYNPRPGCGIVDSQSDVLIHWIAK